ncbi:MAG: site-specific DNA-methyltransferase, partial [Chlorobium sp.]
MTRNYDKLKTLLIELFQLNQPDLDFGLYRIMHAKSAEVTQFLDRELLPQVTAAFGQFRSTDKAEMERELNKVIAGVEAAGMYPEQSPKVQALREQLKNDGVDVGRLESEVYDHLFSFFRRYYSEGDFLAKRVYKPGVYAIPYEGEEVMLHWANKDQYYIKTSEYLRDYAFRLRPDLEEMPMRVHFRLADVTEGEHGNVKASEGKERRFKLAEENPVALEDGELMIRFTYQPDTVKQKELNAAAEEAIAAMGDASLTAWITELGKPNVRSDGSSSGTRLRLHLDRYTARNTFDYFIHKDLGGFLRRELDFFIKNEVMHLDDIESESAPRVEQYLSKIRVIRKIAGKIIDFLAQLENFQKRLWLKKKFVVETRYCITLDRIPAEFYGEIAANPKQWEQWRTLGMLETPNVDKPDLFSQAEVGSVGYLEAHPFLMADTALFDEAFKSRLLSTVDNLDETLDGLLMHGDNFHGLNLLQARYREQVKCVYIDPPYNTGGDGFPYKDNYQHASWLTMISERLDASYPLLTENSVMFSSIDALERNHLESVLDSIFGRKNRVEEIIWVQNTTKNQSPTYSTNHEYVEVYSKNIEIVKSDFSMFRESKPGFIEIMELIEKINPLYPPITEVESELRNLFRAHKAEITNDGAEPIDEWRGIYNYNRAEYRDGSGRYVDASDAKKRNTKIWVWREVDTSMPQIKEDSQKAEFRDPNNSAYRFYTPVHPVTGKACPAPKRGWSWPFNPLGKQKSCFSELVADHRIAWGDDENKIPQRKSFLHEVETNVSKSVVNDYTDGEKELTNLFGKSRTFGGPKPTTLIERFCQQASVSRDFVCDFFAGSGTTAHAVISLNRQDQGKRKYILVEQGDYFDTVLKPRIQKVVYSSDWKDGKAKAPQTGLSHAFKVLKLESYEDALNNLEPRRTRHQQLTLDSPEAQGAECLKEQYILRYMLDVETRGSQSLLNVQAFTDPTAYKLKVKR